MDTRNYYRKPRCAGKFLWMDKSALGFVVQLLCKYIACVFVHPITFDVIHLLQITKVFDVTAAQCGKLYALVFR
jgi:hypothetical protein